MSLEMLEQAVAVKKQKKKLLTAAAQVPESNDGTAITTLAEEDDSDDVYDEITESSYLILSHSESSSSMNSSGLSSSANGYYRTGRWTEEETEFVDFLLRAFDLGVLPMPVGVRLNDFLCNVLLCKASRLTKKMKNARLSVRAYEILQTNNDSNSTSTSWSPESEMENNNSRSMLLLDCEMFSTLQEKFLQSIGNESAQLELRFNMDKAWRTNLSNLCVQVGCTMLDVTAWMASLEQMERRAALAEENIRKARRRRMGMALRTDVRAPQGVFFSNMPVQPVRKNVKSISTSQHEDQRENGLEFHSVSSSDDGDTKHISNMLDVGESHNYNGAVDTADDFAVIFDELIGDTAAGSSNRGSSNNNCGSFLEQVLSYMEVQQLPFEHVDVWVPSYAPNASLEQPNVQAMRLHHAGHATRSELLDSSTTFGELHEYGEYSTKFSFATGVGLPGRVYQTGQPSWECHIDEADPKIFERAGGAKVYGIKTGVGFPISSIFIGRVVVVMYSLVHLPVDDALLQQINADLTTFCPKPKWKLVVEMGSEVEAQSTKPEDSASDISPHQQGAAGYASNAQESVKPPPPPQLLTSSPLLGSGPVELSLSKLANAAKVSQDDLGMSFNSLSTCQSRPSNLDTAKNDAGVEDQRDEEIRIATLLGDFMPGAEIPIVGVEPKSATSNGPRTLLPFYMSLRLLLLRSSERRSAEENALLEVMIKSYRGFSQDSNRSKKEVAYLLANDWQFLTTTSSMNELKQPAAALDSKKRPANVHQCHVMNIPSVSTYIATGVPVSMPFSLGANPGRGSASSSRHSSFDDTTNAGNKKRRYNTGSISSRSVSIVDES